MRLEGDIEVIREIEQFIVNNTQYDLVKDMPREHIFKCDAEPTYYTKSYMIWLGSFFEFDIKLTYDLRINKGKFIMSDEYSYILFCKHPELSVLLSKMNNIQLSQYTGGNHKIEDIPVKEQNIDVKFVQKEI